MLPVVTAQEEVADTWLSWDGSTTVQDNPVTVLLNSGNNALQVSIGDNSSVITQDSCREIGVYEACFEEVSTDEKPDIDEEGQLRPGVRLVIYEQEDVLIEGGTPEMSVTAESTGRSLTDTHDVSVFFDNTGDGAMFNFSAEVTPRGISAESDEEDVLRIGSSSYRVTGGIEAGDNKSLRLSYEPTTLTPSLHVAYTYDSTEEGTVTGEKNLSLPLIDPLETSVSGPATTNLFESNEIVTSITNNAQQELVANVTTNQSRNQILAGRDYEVGDDAVVAQASVAANETEELVLSYQPRYTGETLVETRIDGVVASFTPNTSHQLAIDTPEPSVMMETSVEPTSPGGNATVSYTFTNQNEYVLEDVIVTITSEYGVERHSLSNITAQSSTTKGFAYQTPFGALPGNYTMDVSTDYETIAGETFETSQQRTLSLLRNDYDVIVERSVNNTNPSINDSVSVDVYVENTGENLLPNATISESVSPTDTNASRVITLRTGERVKAYSYTLNYTDKTTFATRVTSGQFTHQSYQTLTGETREPPAENTSNSTQNTTLSAPQEEQPSLANNTGNDDDKTNQSTSASEEATSTAERVGEFFEGLVAAVQNALPWGSN